MNNNNKTKSSGTGLCGLLTVLFVVLKLCGVIKWSWIWVFAPTWIPLVLVVVISLIYILK